MAVKPRREAYSQPNGICGLARAAISGDNVNERGARIAGRARVIVTHVPQLGQLRPAFRAGSQMCLHARTFADI